MKEFILIVSVSQWQINSMHFFFRNKASMKRIEKEDQIDSKCKILNILIERRNGRTHYQGNKRSRDSC